MQLHRSVLTIVLLFATIATTHAADTGFEISTNVGVAAHPKNHILHVPGVPALTGRGDGSDASWSAALAYHFNRNIALSLGYVRFGDSDAELADATGTTNARSNVEFAAQGVTFAMIGKFPLGNWEPFIRAGLLWSDTELRYNGSVAGNAFAASIDGHDLDMFVGAGVAYKLGDRWQIRLEVTFQEVGKPETGRSDFLGSYIGLGWKF